MSTANVEFGYALPGYSKYERPEPFLEIARAAEDAGFDALWSGEHVTIPEAIDYESYPFGVPDWADISTPRVDVFQTFAAIAAVTDEIHMGPNICVVPLRHPILLAKHALSLAALSKGRFEFGVGSGWLRSEFEVLDAPYEQRGQFTDEFLELFEQIFETGGETGFDGDLIEFQKTGFHPVPDEKPPIWVGGTSGPAFRRTAEFGDGWTVVSYTPEEVAAARDRLMNAWRDFEREGLPRISARRRVHVGEWNGERPDISSVGDPEEIVADVEEYAAAGTTQLIVSSLEDDIGAEVEQIRRFGESVIPAFE